MLFIKISTVPPLKMIQSQRGAEVGLLGISLVKEKKILTYAALPQPQE